MFPLPLFMYFEIGALLLSIIFYNKIKNSHLKWILPFLLFMVIVEFSGRYMQKELKLVNAWIFNISIPIEYFFYSYLFFKSYHTAIFKKIALLIMVSIPVFAIINIFFIQGFYTINTNILKAGSSLMLVLCCLYLVDIFRREEEVDLLNDAMFWITTGLLFFNVGELTYNMFFDYILSHSYDQRVGLFTSINNKLIYVLYSFISIALICSKTIYRKI